MTVINNLMKLCVWRRTLFQVLGSNSKNLVEFYCTNNLPRKNRLVTPKIHAYVVQKSDTSQILSNAEKLKEILKKKGRLSAVDMDLCAKINTSTLNEILMDLHSFILLDRTYFFDSLFYKVFIEYLKKGTVDQLKWDQLIQVIYYAAYMQDPETKMVLLKCLHAIKKHPELLTADYRDLCLIMASAFKESTRFTSHENLMKRVKQILKNEFFILVEDSIWLSMICKGLSSTYFNEKQTLTELAENLKNCSEVERFSLLTASRIIELYSKALFKDEVLLNTLVRAFARDIRNYLDKCSLKNKRSLRPPRIKDLGIVMYSLMRLNHSVEKSLLDTVFVPIYEYIASEKLRQKYEHYTSAEIACLIGFWFLGYDLSLLGNSCQKVVEAIPKSFFRHQEYQQCHLFLDILDLAYPKLSIPNFGSVKNTISKSSLDFNSQLLTKRGNLIYLQKTIEKFKTDLHVSKCYIENIVPSLYTEGVSVEIGFNKIHIDVPELRHCLLDSEELNGFMVSKMKLVKCISNVSHHIVLPNSEIVNLSKLKDKEVVSRLKEFFKGSKKAQNMYYWQI